MLAVAILCGGKGTRANPPDTGLVDINGKSISEPRPGQRINKCFQEVNGKPFILRQMELLESYGFTTFVLCRGDEGSLTALRKARDQLGERFLLLYGDTYLKLPYDGFVRAWDNSKRPGITAFWGGIDAGVNGISTWMLDLLDEFETDLSRLQAALWQQGLMHLYSAPEKWHEVGTPEALAETRAALI